MKIAYDKDKVEAAVLRFRIHHGLTDERADEIGCVNLHHLWLRWRIDHDLPLKDEEWELHAGCWESWIESISVWSDEGNLIGHLSICKPPSPELTALLPKAA
jgi:hypothetical protein